MSQSVLLNTRTTAQFEPTMVLFHGKCPDGFGAAWVFWRWLQQLAVYIPVSHGQQLPSVRHHHVIMVDVSFPKPLLDSLVRQTKQFQLLDHHHSAHHELKDAPYAHFDLERSGIGLAWQFVHGDLALPQLAEVIQKRDLSQPLTEEEEAVLHVLDTQGYDFEAWDRLMTRCEEQWDSVVQEGQWMRKKFIALGERLIENAMPLSLHGLTGWVANTPKEFSSYVAFKLTEWGDFGLTWYTDESGVVHLSFRSSKVNVVPLAQHFGGGGGERSAGARLSLHEWALFLGQQRNQSV